MRGFPLLGVFESAYWFGNVPVKADFTAVERVNAS